jgi:predicted enzyme related to lactoylglutathione lyase
MAQAFIWYELMTTDPEAAGNFYRDVVGWEAADAGGPNAGYTLFFAPGRRGVGGMMQLPQEAAANGAPPRWVGYVAVPDIEAAVEGVRAAGGTVHKDAAEIPQVGRFAVVTDPGGTLFQLLQPNPMESPPEPLPRMSPGNVGWHELYAADGDAALAFYSEQFGWQEMSRFDMGPMGIYHIWGPQGAAEAVGGMMTKPEQAPRPAWIFYFVVEGVEAGAERIRERGGAILMGPMEVPDGSWVVQGRDPQGAMFALVSKTR